MKSNDVAASKQNAITMLSAAHQVQHKTNTRILLNKRLSIAGIVLMAFQYVLGFVLQVSDVNSSAYVATVVLTTLACLTFLNTWAYRIVRRAGVRTRAFNVNFFNPSLFVLLAGTMTVNDVYEHSNYQLNLGLILTAGGFILVFPLAVLLTKFAQRP